MFNKRKQWLKADLKRINKIIDTFPFKYEIKMEGIKQIREGIRMDYDKQKEKIDACKVKIGSEREKEWKDQDHKVIKDMQDFQEKLEKEIKAMEEQMKELDIEFKEAEMTKNSRIEAARSYRSLVLKLLKK